jgi:hypothetical protein
MVHKDCAEFSVLSKGKRLKESTQRRKEEKKEKHNAEALRHRDAKKSKKRFNAEA